MGRSRRLLTKRGRRAVRISFVVFVGLFLAAPLIYLIAGSLMSEPQLMSYPPQFLPTSLHFHNYSQAWSDVLQLRTFENSIIFTVGVVAIQWALCISGGLVISKMRFRGRNVLTSLFGISLFIPILTTLIPAFIITNKFQLVNTYPGLILPIAAQTGFGTLLFRQFITTLPEELFDAARMDGATWWTILRKLIVPLARPATAAYVAISVLTAWNMYLWPLVVAQKGNLEVLTQVVGSLGANAYGYTVPENVVFAATVITTLPMIVAFLFVQPAFRRGLTGSGVE